MTDIERLIELLKQFGLEYNEDKAWPKCDYIAVPFSPRSIFAGDLETASVEFEFSKSGEFQNIFISDG